MRRTLKFISLYPTPQELYNKITKSAGWPYKTNLEFYRLRDPALVALLYLLGLRVSEALRLKKEQFIVKPDLILVRAIKQSKRTEKSLTLFREEGFLTLRGERSKLSQLVLNYLEYRETPEHLFSFTRQRAWQIVTAVTGEPCHWLRAYCENYLYDEWNKDILAVADYMKIHPRTLPLYIRKAYKKYRPK